MNNTAKAPASPSMQLQYISRVKSAAKHRDAKMLDALYAQCEQLNVVVPHYEIADIAFKRNEATGRPAVERLVDGTLLIHMYESVEINGETKPLQDWCKENNLTRGGLRYRLSIGKTLEEALTTPKVVYYTQR